MSSDARDSSSLSICSGLAVSSSGVVVLPVIGVLSAIVESGSYGVAAMASAQQQSYRATRSWNTTQLPVLLYISSTTRGFVLLAMRLVSYMPLAILMGKTLSLRGGHARRDTPEINEDSSPLREAPNFHRCGSS